MKSIALMLSLLTVHFVSAQSEVNIKQYGDTVSISNTSVNLDFNLKTGMFNIAKPNGNLIVSNAYFQAEAWQSKDTLAEKKWQPNDVNDELGNGKSITIHTKTEGGFNMSWTAILYKGQPYVIFKMAIENNRGKADRLRAFYPVICGEVYKGKDTRENYSVLDGNGGGGITRVSSASDLLSFNNAMFKFGPLDKSEVFVAGGVTYHEFEKFVKIVCNDKSFSLQLYAQDPVGKLIDAGNTYAGDESFYLCFDNKNPFEALEQYAAVLKKAQKIELGYYDFPTECLWYATTYIADKSRGGFNNSKGAVEEMDYANKSGITKYVKAAIRLVPDAYGPNNQQGWWDDEHWAKYSSGWSSELPNYTDPYLTTKSWSQAILSKGGIPITYVQSARRSEDFAKLHPEWMLFNDSYRMYGSNPTIVLMQESSYPNPRSAQHGTRQWWSDRQLWGYDFTDPGFIAHMKKVYANLKDAGIKGLFFDYPEVTAWAYEGGFEDKYATTAWAYRNMFQLAKDGLEKGALLQERNMTRGSDVTLGTIASQRVWADADSISAEMVSYGGLRWYKNRVVINYDMDSKDPRKAMPKENKDGSRSMYTMTYVASSRFLLARSFSELTPEEIHDMSRTFPYHTTAQSARPLDAFTNGKAYPEVYDFKVNENWRQLTFYNYDKQNKKIISVWPGQSLNEGGMELDPQRQYYVYDFWNNNLIGLIDGNKEFVQELRAGEARMMAIHAKENNPQFIATTRHIMQGYIDLKDVKWNDKAQSLTGVASVVEGDPFEVIIATNGKKIKGCKTYSAECSIKTIDEKNGIAVLTINAAKTAPVKWDIRFK